MDHLILNRIPPGHTRILVPAAGKFSCLVGNRVMALGHRVNSTAEAYTCYPLLHCNSVTLSGTGGSCRGPRRGVSDFGPKFGSREFSQPEACTLCMGMRSDCNTGTSSMHQFPRELHNLAVSRLATLLRVWTATHHNILRSITNTV